MLPVSLKQQLLLSLQLLLHALLLCQPADTCMLACL